MPNPTPSSPGETLLPGLSRSEATARTLIAQRAHALPVRVGDVAWQASLVPVVHPVDIPEPGYRLRMEWAGALLELELPAAAVEQGVASLIDSTRLTQLPPTLAIATLEAVIQQWLPQWHQLGRGTPNILDIQPLQGRAEARLPHALALTLSADAIPTAMAGTLYCDNLGLLLMAGLLHKLPAAAPAAAFDVPLPLRAEIGFTRVTLDELQTLARGDVVLITTSHIASERTLWLCIDGVGALKAQLPEASAGLAPAALTVIQSWSPLMPNDLVSEAAAASPETPSGSPDPMPTLESLPIRLTFDLGTLDFTLAQLRQLQPGQTIDLARPLASAVAIRANGALIAEGDLVEIDGQLGVSLSRVLGAPGA